MHNSEPQHRDKLLYQKPGWVSEGVRRGLSKKFLPGKSIAVDHSADPEVRAGLCLLPSREYLSTENSESQDRGRIWFEHV